MLYCIVLYCIVLCCIVLYCIVLYCIVLYCIVLYCIVLYYIILFIAYRINNDITLRYMALHYIPLHYIGWLHIYIYMYIHYKLEPICAIATQTGGTPHRRRCRWTRGSRWCQRRQRNQRRSAVRALVMKLCSSTGTLANYNCFFGVDVCALFPHVCYSAVKGFFGP